MKHTNSCKRTNQKESIHLANTGKINNQIQLKDSEISMKLNYFVLELKYGPKCRLDSLPQIPI